MAEDYFIIDCESHPMSIDRLREVSYFTSFKRFMSSGGGASVPLSGEQWTLNPTPEGLLADMDAAGVDMACVLPEVMTFATGETGPISSTGFMANVVRQNPDRFILTPNFGPIIKRGINEAIWEMGFMASKRNVRIFKFYPPEDTSINDKRLWPFFAKAQELGLVMSVHVGMNYTYGGKTEYCHPLLLEDVCNDFYDLRILAFHFGWPFNHELNVLASTYPNLYISMSMLLQSAKHKPVFFQHLLGEAIQYATVDKVIWGTDWPGCPMGVGVAALRDVQIDEELQKGYGYKAISDEDRQKMFGLNLAGLLGIEPTKKAKAAKKS
jgi:predicted TIM-barrel fold metal-dependent hydrolase